MKLNRRKFCECGCGAIVKNRFVNGHYWKDKTGAHHFLFGKKLSEEHKSKISKIHKDRKRSEETRRKIGEGNKGKMHSEESKRKMSDAHKGKKNPDQSKRMKENNPNHYGMCELHKEKISAAKKVYHKNNPGVWKGKHLGMKLSEEARRKISESRKGRFVGKDNSFYGKKHSEKTKKRLSEANRGENSFLYKGGINIYPEEWAEELREKIRKRDNYQCQLCRMKQEESNRALDVYHIDNDRINCQPENLITLCRSCHSKIVPLKELGYRFLLEDMMMQRRANVENSFGAFA